MRVVLRRAQLDEKIKQQIQKKVRQLLQQKQNGDQPDSVDSQAENDSGEGTVYLFDASECLRGRIALEFNTRKEYEEYKRKTDIKPETKVKILDEGKGKSKPEPEGEDKAPSKEDDPSKSPRKPEESETSDKSKKPDADKSKAPDKKPESKKPESPKTEKPDEKSKPKDDEKGTPPIKAPEDREQQEKQPEKTEREPGQPLEHSHPARIPEGTHRQVAIKDHLIDEFGTDAKNWKVHKLHPSQLSYGTTIRFPDGASKKWGTLTPEEKNRVTKAISEGLAASKGLSDYSNVSPATLKHNMESMLSQYDDPDVEEPKNESEDEITKDNVAEFTNGVRETGRTLLKKYRGVMSRYSRPMAEQMVDDICDTVAEATRDGSLGSVKQKDVDEFVRESVKRVLHQEAETRRRSLGDHGIRHVAGNCQSTMKMLGELQTGGVKITGKQKFMALAAMVDHDIGYTVGEVGTNIAMGKAHKKNSADLVGQEKERMDTIFGREDGDKVRAMIATHDDQNYDWEGDPVSSSVRLADNTSLFGRDKVQDLFLRSSRATELACKLKLAASAKPDDKKLQDDIKAQLHEVVDGDEFEDADKELLHAQIDEMSEGKFSTTTDILSRFSGELDGFKYDSEKKMMHVNMRYSQEGQMVDELFGDEVACRQFEKMVDGLDGKPVRGKRGNTIFKNKEGGKPAFQLNIDGFAEEGGIQTAPMRDFASKTARTELRRASMQIYPPPPASERDMERAKKTLEPAKEKFSKDEWKKLMEAFDEGDPGELAKKLGAWPLLQSEMAFLKGKTASQRIVGRLVRAFLADRITRRMTGDAVLEEVVGIDREFNREAGRGQQLQRKDKDLMSDTGGVSKTRRREPEQKPPRDDSRNRYRTKTKTPDERDPDVDRKAFVAEATGIRRVTYYLATTVETCDRCNAAIKQVAVVEWKDGTKKKFGSECINKILAGDTSLKGLFRKNMLLLRKYQTWLEVLNRPVERMPKVQEYYGSGIWIIGDDSGEAIHVDRGSVMFHPDVDLERNSVSNYAFVDEDTVRHHSGKQTYEMFREKCHKDIGLGKAYLQREVNRLELFLARVVEKGLAKAEQMGIPVQASDSHPLDQIEKGVFGTIPENNYHRKVLNRLVGIMGEIQQVSEKDFSGQSELQRAAEEIIRSESGEEVVQAFQDVGARPEMCAEGVYFEFFIRGKKMASERYESMARLQLASYPRTLKEAVKRG